MFGNGIGALNVYIRGSNSGDRKVWSLTGDAGTAFIPEIVCIRQRRILKNLFCLAASPKSVMVATNSAPNFYLEDYI